MERIKGFLFSPLFAGILIVAAYIMAVSAVADKSPTFDEVTHLTGGYGIWLKDDYRLLPDNGNLSQRWGALPSLWRSDRFPDITQNEWKLSNVYAMDEQLFYQLGNDAGAMMFQARCMMALLLIAIGVLIYFWSRSLFGPEGALVSVVLFAFCPSMLGHGSLVASDVMVTFFFFASMGALWRLMQRVDVFNVVLCGIVLTGVFLAKVSGVLIIPMGLLLLVMRLENAESLPVQWRQPVRSCWGKLLVMSCVLPVLIFIVWIGIWATFGFRYSAFSDFNPYHNRLFPGGWEYAASKPGLLTDVVQELRIGQLLPEAYLFGILMVSVAGQVRQSFLNGDFSIYGFHGFFPYAFSVKETLPFLLLLLLALCAVVMAVYSVDARVKGARFRYFWNGIYKASPLWIVLVVYGLFAFTSNLNIGHRHLFPLYPPLFVLAGAAGFWIRKNVKWLAALVVALLLWHAEESLAVRPNYLTYFNQIAGGPSQGYRHLVDSSLDWGQDLPGLKDWLSAHQLEDGRTPVYLLYFGSANTEYYGVKATLLPGFLDRGTPSQPIEPLKPGVYAISATLYQGIYLAFCGPWTDRYEQVYRAQTHVLEQLAAAKDKPDELKKLVDLYTERNLQTVQQEYPRLRIARLCAWLRQTEKKPEAFINNTIFIFRLSQSDLDTALR
jgi:4-amino-4-deoxy-L-arabinose transferase-like glycosyltransferase